MDDARFHSLETDESVLAEVALGVVDPAEVPGLALHLAGCPACRTQLVELTATADRLVLLAPESAPPAGFADRVVLSISGPTSANPRDRMSADRAGRPAAVATARSHNRRAGTQRHSRHPLRTAAAAVVVAAVLGMGAAVAVRAARDHRTSAPMASPASEVYGSGSRVPESAITAHPADLVAPSGSTVGLVRLARDDRDQGVPTTMTVVLRGLEPGVRYRCNLVLVDGTRREVGAWTVGSASDRWNVAVPNAPADRVEITDDRGSLVATATLR